MEGGKRQVSQAPARAGDLSQQGEGAEPGRGQTGKRARGRRAEKWGAGSERETRSP